MEVSSFQGRDSTVYTYVACRSTIVKRCVFNLMHICFTLAMYSHMLHLHFLLPSLNFLSPQPPLSYLHRSEEAYTKVLSLAPSFPRSGEVHLQLGLLLKRRRAYDEAAAHFEKALNKHDPQLDKFLGKKMSRMRQSR